MKAYFLVLITFILSSCNREEPIFIDSSNDEDAVIVGLPLWQDKTQQINLVVRAVDLGGMGHVSWLSLEKSLPNGDTLEYRLSNMGIFDSNRDYKKFEVFADTLYLYDKESRNVGFTGLEKNDSLGYEHEDSKIITQYTIDTLKMKTLYYGIYKWESNDFVLVDRNTSNFRNYFNLDYKGILYLAPPGAEIKHKYSLRAINEKLSKVNTTWDAPNAL